jgi:hypothetical protein
MKEWHGEDREASERGGSSSNRKSRQLRDMAVCLTALALATLTSGGVLAAGDACQPVKDAIGKLNAAQQFQQRGIVTYIDSGKSYSLDYLVSGNKEYSRKEDGAWKIDTRQPVALVVGNEAAVYECRRIGTDRLGNASAVIYTYKRLTPDHRVRNVKAWIAEDTGEPLQTEMTIETEPGRKARFMFNYDQNASLPMVGDQ